MNFSTTLMLIGVVVIILIAVFVFGIYVGKRNSKKVGDVIDSVDAFKPEKK